ncbi:MAG: multicopper oxidase domain-containing protein [Ottowia sp.]|nr:multicopper oxidase domain-containing protein [Ottowia sp.]
MNTDLSHPTRRDLLHYAGAGSAALLGGLPAVRAFAQAADTFNPDLALELRAAPNSVALRPGAATSVWSYQARVLKGDPASVQPLPGSYLGPILRVRRGQKLRIDFINDLDQASIVHWHGLHVPDTMDGHPRLAIGPGERYRYEFEVQNRAGTYWYHPHHPGARAHAQCVATHGGFMNANHHHPQDRHRRRSGRAAGACSIRRPEVPGPGRRAGTRCACACGQRFPGLLDTRIGVVCTARPNRRGHPAHRKRLARERQPGLA